MHWTKGELAFGDPTPSSWAISRSDCCLIEFTHYFNSATQYITSFGATVQTYSEVSFLLKNYSLIARNLLCLLLTFCFDNSGSLCFDRLPFTGASHPRLAQGSCCSSGDRSSLHQGFWKQYSCNLVLEIGSWSYRPYRFIRWQIQTTFAWWSCSNLEFICLWIHVFFLPMSGCWLAWPCWTDSTPGHQGIRAQRWVAKRRYGHTGCSKTVTWKRFRLAKECPQCLFWYTMGPKFIMCSTLWLGILVVKGEPVHVFVQPLIHPLPSAIRTSA